MEKVSKTNRGLTGCSVLLVSALVSTGATTNSVCAARDRAAAQAPQVKFENYLDKGKTRKAFALYETYIKKNPSDSWAIFQLAKLKHHLRDEQGALADIDKAIALDNHSSYYFFKANVLDAMGRYNDAEETLMIGFEHSGPMDAPSMLLSAARFAKLRNDRTQMLNHLCAAYRAGQILSRIEITNAARNLAKDEGFKLDDCKTSGDQYTSACFFSWIAHTEALLSNVSITERQLAQELGITEIPQETDTQDDRLYADNSRTDRPNLSVNKRTSLPTITLSVNPARVPITSADVMEKFGTPSNSPDKDKIAYQRPWGTLSFALLTNTETPYVLLVKLTRNSKLAENRGVQ